MSQWRPTAGEERWLEVGARLRGAIPRDALTARTGGWRSTGPLARIALFVLGLLAVALVFGILGFDSDTTMLVAGLAAVGATEWLKVGRRLHASGIEEGLCIAGYLLIAAWAINQVEPLLGSLDREVAWVVLTVAAGAAGLRLLNPLLTTGAALAFIEWLGSTRTALVLDAATTSGMIEPVIAVGAAAVALWAGAREFRRPSHDSMLDWLVVALPVHAYAQHAGRSAMAVASGEPETTARLILASALLLAFGIAALMAGLRRRRHAPLLGFIACVACLAVELARVSTWPVEYWLVFYGIAAIVVSAAIDRRLRRPREGITSARLTDREGPLALLQTAGVAVLAQRVSPEAPPREPEAPAHEGRFGGGGASGNF